MNINNGMNCTFCLQKYLRIMKTIFVIVLVIVVTLASTQALSCLPCVRTSCQPVSKLNCKGGLTKDVCGCCIVCAKVEGERCGLGFSINIFFGICDRGLTTDLNNTGSRI